MTLSKNLDIIIRSVEEEIENDSIVVVQCGREYQTLGSKALKLSLNANLKLTRWAENQETFLCGFPVWRANEIKNKLKENDISLFIVSDRSEEC